MKIFGMEKLSLVDYDGFISATVFTGGCNFNCNFCHNAVLVNGYSKLNVYPENEVFEYLNKRRGVLEGVCISGGEPTLQSDLPAFCEKIKKLGYSVKLDTNGTNPKMLQNLFENGLIDYVAMDIKNDREHYGKIIGIEDYNTAAVEKSVDYLMNSKLSYEFRTTLISEYHGVENVVKIGEWITGAKKYFFQRFKDGDNCMKRGLTDVPLAKAQEFVEAVKPLIPSTLLRGYDL